MALPDVFVGLWITRFEMVFFCAQLGRKLGIVAPVDPLDPRTRQRPDDEALVGVVFLEVRVECHPDLRPRPADRRNENVEGMLRDGLPLLDPNNIEAFKAFDL